MTGVMLDALAARGGEERPAAPLVSVVMPVFNAGGFLTEAIASVFAQTHPAIELLLVDDGSTDGSDALLRDAAARDPERVRVLAHPGRVNRGTHAARYLALDAARGPLVAFLDQDDVWLPGMLANAIALLEARPEAGMLVGPALYWHSWDGRPAHGAWDHIVPTGLPSGTCLAPPAALVHWLREPGLVPCPAGIVVRRDVLRAQGGPTDNFPAAYEDQIIFARMAMAAPVVFSGACLTLYRQHDRSAWAASKREGRDPELRREWLRWLSAEVDARGEGDPALRDALAAAVRAVDVSPPPAPPPPPAARLRALARAGARAVLPVPARRALRRLRTGAGMPPVGAVRFGDLRRVAPLDGNFGYGRGTPVDRRYIEAFLAEHAADVRGRTLEIGDASYTLRYGGARVTRPDVLHVHGDNPHATIVADLEAWPDAPENAFDCILLTQTLHLLYDVRAAMVTLHRLLAPGGVLLLTAPGLSPIDPSEWRRSWYWSLTEYSMRRLVDEAFGPGRGAVRTYGNVLTATAFLQGLAAEELTDAEYAAHDPSYAVVVAARAVKGAAPGPAA